MYRNWSEAFIFASAYLMKRCHNKSKLTVVWRTYIVCWCLDRWWFTMSDRVSWGPKSILPWEHRCKQLPEPAFSREPWGLLPSLCVHIQGFHRRHVRPCMGRFCLRCVFSDGLTYSMCREYLSLKMTYNCGCTGDKYLHIICVM